MPTKAHVTKKAEETERRVEAEGHQSAGYEQAGAAPAAAAVDAEIGFPSESPSETARTSWARRPLLALYGLQPAKAQSLNAFLLRRYQLQLLSGLMHLETPAALQQNWLFQTTLSAATTTADLLEECVAVGSCQAGGAPREKRKGQMSAVGESQ